MNSHVTKIRKGNLSEISIQSGVLNFRHYLQPVSNILSLVKLLIYSQLDLDSKELLARYALGERDFQGVDLSGSSLPGADLRQANFSKTILCRSNLQAANLLNANLREANLGGSNLFGANLCYANLQNANLCYANLSGANLRRADLRGANLSGVTLWRAELGEASLEGAFFDKMTAFPEGVDPEQLGMHFIEFYPSVQVRKRVQSSFA